MVVVLAMLFMVDILVVVDIPVGDPILMEGDTCFYKSLGIIILIVVG